MRGSAAAAAVLALLAAMAAPASIAAQAAETAGGALASAVTTDEAYQVERLCGHMLCSHCSCRVTTLEG